MRREWKAWVGRALASLAKLIRCPRAKIACLKRLTSGICGRLWKLCHAQSTMGAAGEAGTQHASPRALRVQSRGLSVLHWRFSWREVWVDHLRGCHKSISFESGTILLWFFKHFRFLAPILSIAWSKICQDQQTWTHLEVCVQVYASSSNAKSQMLWTRLNLQGLHRVRQEETVVLIFSARDLSYMWHLAQAVQSCSAPDVQDFKWVVS